MFSEEFYPTPKKVIGTMLRPFLKPDKDDEEYGDRLKKLDNLTILEPSAGKGNILDYIQSETNQKADDLYCIEMDPNLKHILQGKGYKVIADNFLTYSGDHHFDLIVMNPPFSNGVDHVLKAWELLDEGYVVSLINSQTVLNPNSEKKKHLLSLIEKHGSVEHIGQVFMNSKETVQKSRYRNDDEEDDGTVERTTTVECSIIRLKKASKASKFDFEFKQINKEKSIHLDEDTFKDPVATRDVIGNMILQYDELKKQFVEYMKIAEAINFYGQGLTKEYNTAFAFAIKAYGAPGSKQKKKEAYNTFSDWMKSDIWNVVIRKTNIEKYMTHQVRKNFDEFCRNQGYMDFTKENVAGIIAMIFENRYDILEKAIVEIFDIFTERYSENRYMIDSWKTNDKWKVNRKVILPNAISYGDYMNAHNLKQYGDNMRINYSRESQYSDIDKVMCYISGRNFDTCHTLYRSLHDHLKRLGRIHTGDKFDNIGESDFFTYKFWKKGTLHIEFKNKDLWEEFNMRACASKMWLPEAEEKQWKEKRKKSQPAPQPKPEQLQLSEFAELDESIFD